MANETWNADTFRPDLTARLVTALGGVRDAAALAIAVAESAAGPEAACCGREMACTAGCPHCCVLNVAILLPEAMVIADWARDRLLPAELADLRQRLEIHRSWTRWMEDEERIVKKATCPFLNDIAHCSIHPVRPLACRGVASLDRNSCLEAFVPIYTDEARMVLADLLRQAAFDDGFSALAQALHFHDIDDRSIDLGCGVLGFLEHPDYKGLLLRGERLPRELWL